VVGAAKAKVVVSRVVEVKVLEVKVLVVRGLGATILMVMQAVK